MSAPRRWLRYFAPLASIAILAIALNALRHLLAAVSLSDVLEAFRHVAPSRIALSLLFAAAGYAALVAYDVLAFSHEGTRITLRRTVLTSFIANALSQSLGFTVILGGAVRYRMYSAWGLDGRQIAQSVAFTGITLWLGVLTVGGVVLATDPRATPAMLHLHVPSLRPIGWACLAIVAAYLALAAVRRAPIVVRGRAFEPPSLGVALTQVGLSSVDWILMGSVLYVFLPPESHVPFLSFIGIFLLGMTASLISHVPGGLGVFDAIAVALLAPWAPAAAVVASLVAYRVVYYILPLATGLVCLALYETDRRRTRDRRAAPRPASPRRAGERP
ncbi:MAG: lysylphosphatidylglycerol synthase domain-containing protein [Gemmatimonadaceae bacterium]